MSAISRRTAITALMMAATACSVPRRDSSPDRRPPMWRATLGTSRLWLFGQIALPGGVHWLTPSVVSAFTGSEEVWFENPQFDKSADVAIQKRIAQGGPKLRDVISANDRQRLAEALKKAGRAANLFDTLLPWQAYLSVSELVDSLAGFDPLALPERSLREQARSAGKSIRSEWSSIDEIMNFSAQQTLEQQLQLISKTLDDVITPEEARQRANAWASGDISNAAKREEKLRAKYPELRVRVVSERNARWVPRLLEALERNRATFMCVGLGHLLGEDANQNLLRKAGAHVSRA